MALTPDGRAIKPSHRTRGRRGRQTMTRRNAPIREDRNSGAWQDWAGALAEPAATKVTGCWRENAISVTLQYRTSRPARAEAASRN